MKKLTCFVLCLLLAAGLSWSAEWVNLTGSAEPVAVDVLESVDNKVVLNYQLNGFERDEIVINGESYAFIGLDDESRLWVKGYPELPRLCRSVIIPDDGLMAAAVLHSEYVEISGMKIAPSKGHFPRSIDPSDVPYEFAEIYQMDAWYPEKVVELRDPYILRDLRGQVVEVNAFQYNPERQVLRVYTQLTVEVSQVGIGGANVLQRTDALTRMDTEFKRIYGRHFVNFDPDRYIAVEEIGPMLIITHDGFRDAVLPLADWKNQKGIPTTVVNVSSIGNNADAIKNYISSVYFGTELTFVLLVGDAAQVATPSGGEDPTYAQLEGSDHYPELFVGRFSAETVEHVDTQVERTIEYEKYPQVDADWYHKGIGLASNQGPGHYGENDDEHMDLIRGDLLRYTYTEVDQFYDPYATSNMVTNAMNEGRGTVNYCGHGSTTSWGTTGFNVGDVNALVNDNMLHFGTTVACLCGNFANSTCFAEAWLRATHNGEPTGAIGFFASSISQSWSPPMYAQDEFIDLMVGDLFHSFGALCFNGVMLMIDETGGSGNNEADHWTVFGDPSFQVRTDTPVDLTVTHDNQINFGQTTFDVTISGVEGALAALSAEGTFLGNDYSNASGLATIEITGPLPAGANVTLTVTAYNGIPYITELPVIGSAPNVAVTLAPVGMPIQIPASGGSFDYNIAATNYEATQQVFHAWCDVTLPGGTVYGPVFGPVTVTLDAGLSVDRDRTQNVPAGAPAGTYSYNAYVGVYPIAEWSVDNFSFEKLSDGDGVPVLGWENSGEAFDEWVTSTSVESPGEFTLLSAYPNPFNPAAAIGFALPEASRVTLSVYDVSGRQVATLVNGWRDAGLHEASFDASGLASGVYIYRLEAGEFAMQSKMVLMK